eukprot:scaffold29_cov251-Pinguiococcus_pyrenoidosus.AAC.33
MSSQRSGERFLVVKLRTSPESFPPPNACITASSTISMDAAPYLRIARRRHKEEKQGNSRTFCEPSAPEPSIALVKSRLFQPHLSGSHLALLRQRRCKCVQCVHEQLSIVMLQIWPAQQHGAVLLELPAFYAPSVQGDDLVHLSGSQGMSDAGLEKPRKDVAAGPEGGICWSRMSQAQVRVLAWSLKMRGDSLSVHFRRHAPVPQTMPPRERLFARCASVKGYHETKAKEIRAVDASISESTTVLAESHRLVKPRRNVLDTPIQNQPVRRLPPLSIPAGPDGLRSVVRRGLCSWHRPQGSPWLLGKNVRSRATSSCGEALLAVLQAWANRGLHLRIKGGEAEFGDSGGGGLESLSAHAGSSPGILTGIWAWVWVWI